MLNAALKKYIRNTFHEKKSFIMIIGIVSCICKYSLTFEDKRPNRRKWPNFSTILEWVKLNIVQNREPTTNIRVFIPE